MKYNGKDYGYDLYNMQLSPHKDADFHTIESKVRVYPDLKTQARYNPAIEPGSPEFWGMVIRAGYVHYQYEKAEIPATYDYLLRKNRKPRGKQFAQPVQTEEVNQEN